MAQSRCHGNSSYNNNSQMGPSYLFSGTEANLLFKNAGTYKRHVACLVNLAASNTCPVPPPPFPKTLPSWHLICLPVSISSWDNTLVRQAQSTGKKIREILGQNLAQETYFAEIIVVILSLFTLIYMHIKMSVLCSKLSCGRFIPSPNSLHLIIR